MKKRDVIRLLLLVLVLILPAILMAQDPNPNGPGDPGCTDNCPIDGGLSILLAAGAAYGAKKYKELKKGKEVQGELEVVGL